MNGPPHRLRGIGAMLLSGFLLAACSSGRAPGGAPTSTSAGGNTGSVLAEVLSPGQVVEGIGGGPGIPLHEPIDGRLAGDQFSLTVEGYGEAASTGADSLMAPPGYTLAVVTYDLEHYGAGGRQPAVAFAAGGKVYPLVGAGSLTGAQNAVVAVPKGSQVELEASLDGLTQVFSFATGSRTGPAPAVIYRDGSRDPELTDVNGRTVTLGVTDPFDGFASKDELTVTSEALTYFAPQDPDLHPATAGGAFLVVAAHEQTEPNAASLSWQTAMPPSRMSLVLANGKVIHADPASTSVQQGPDDLLDGEYYFDVPGTFTRGTIVITPGSERATEYGPDAGVAPETDSVLGAARFPVSFPPPSTPPPAKHPKKKVGRPKSRTGGGGATTTTSATRTSTARGGSSASGSTGETILVVFVLVLVVVLAAGVLMLRRRRRRPVSVDSDARPVRPPPALPFVPMAALMPGPIICRPAPAEPVAPAEVILGPEPARPVEAPIVSPRDVMGVVVYVLGPVEVTGFVRPPKRPVLVALLCFLACHKDRRYSGEELRSALWAMGDDSETKEAGSGTFQTYISLLRAAVGEENLPKASGTGYLVSATVETDWERFSRLTAAARSAPAQARDLLRAALGLVRGKPFAGAGPRYEWAFVDGTVSEIEVGIVRAAAELARLDIEAGEPHLAIAAVRAGLRVSTDFGLSTLWLDAAADIGPEELDRAWRDVGHLLGAEAGRLRAHYELLRRKVSEPSH